MNGRKTDSPRLVGLKLREGTHDILCPSSGHVWSHDHNVNLLHVCTWDAEKSPLQVLDLPKSRYLNSTAPSRSRLSLSRTNSNQSRMVWHSISRTSFTMFPVMPYTLTLCTSNS